MYAVRGVLWPGCLNTSSSITLLSNVICSLLHWNSINSWVHLEVFAICRKHDIDRDAYLHRFMIIFLLTQIYDGLPQHLRALQVKLKDWTDNILGVTTLEFSHPTEAVMLILVSASKNNQEPDKHVCVSDGLRLTPIPTVGIPLPTPSPHQLIYAAWRCHTAKEKNVVLIPLLINCSAVLF